MKKDSQLESQIVPRSTSLSSNKTRKEKRCLDDVIHLAGAMLSEYNLCDSCLGRMFSYRLGLISHKRLGKKIRSLSNYESKANNCDICRGTMSGIPTILSELVSLTRSYEFTTFLIGATLPPSVLDRDDEIRSKFKLVGEHGIKTALTRELGKRFARKSHSSADFRDPDLILHVDIKRGSIDIKSKPLYFMARYVKKKRELAQKATPCEDCGGKGCLWCDFAGIAKHNDSIEGELSIKVGEKLGSQQLRINWIGGEDKESLVLGKGRPIFVKAVNPRKRNLNHLKRISLDNGVELFDIRPIQDMPKTPLRFTNTVSIKIRTNAKISNQDLVKIKQLNNMDVTITEKPKKHVIRRIFCVKECNLNSYDFHNYSHISLRLESEGGIPLKRFVSGEGGVEPSLSQILGTSCTCIGFDFEDVQLQGSCC